MNLQGKFIVIDGTDGTGKSTLIQHLAKKLMGKVHITKEPTNNPFGQELRRVLSANEVLTPIQQTALFYADRIEHQKEINEYCNTGFLVLSDRYYLSNLAYQEYSYDQLKTLNTCSLIRQPDATIILDAHIDIILERIGTRGQLELFENKEKLLSVQSKYKRIIEDNWPYPIKIIDSSGELDFTLSTVVNYLESLFP